MNVQCHGYSENGKRIIVNDTTAPVRITGRRASDGREMAFTAERSELRIAAVPEGYRRYGVRYDDDMAEEATVGNSVAVNHACDILTREDLGLEGRDFIDITDIAIL